MSVKVGIISNWDAHCGVATYARDLATEMAKEFSVDQLPPNGWRSSVYQQDVVIVNWHPARVPFGVEDIQWLRGQNSKTIVVHHNYTGGQVPLEEADVVVGHEPQLVEVAKNFVFIPHGIPNFPEQLRDNHPPAFMIGTAGFPFPWKRFDVVAEAAIRTGTHCRMLAARSDQLDTEAYMNGIEAHLGQRADIWRQWLPIEDVINLLSRCVANIFWFQSMGPEDELGQSGSVRMGLAAGRPTIISTHRKFKTLFPYGDELYIAGREEDVYTSLQEILDNPRTAKRPKRLLADMSWSKTGEQYRKLVRDLCA